MRDGFEILDSPSENPRSTGFQVMGIIHLSEQNLDVIGVSINSKELSGSLVLQRMGSSEILSKQPFNSSFRGAGGKRMYTGEINGILNDIYPIISEKLSDIWAQRLGNKESVIVEIHGANIGNKLSMISRTFDKMLFGVQTVSHTSSGSNHAVFTVGYLGWPEQFLEELNLLLAINKVLNISIEGFDKDQLKLIAN